MGAVHFTDKDFKNEVLENKLPVLVDFFAEWCGPCQAAAPIIDDLSTEYEGKVVIGKLNVDENQGVAGKYEVMSIPTVIMFKDGKEVDRKVGFGGKTGYEEMIKKVL